MNVTRLLALINQKLELESDVTLYDTAMVNDALDDAYKLISADCRLNLIEWVGTNTIASGTIAPSIPYRYSVLDFNPTALPTIDLASDAVIVNGFRMKRMTITDLRDYDPEWDNPNKQKLGDPEYYTWDDNAVVRDYAVPSVDGVPVAPIQGQPRIILAPFSDKTQRAAVQYYRTAAIISSNGASSPWGGKYEEYHEMIAYYAAYQLLQAKGQQFYGSSRFMYSEYERLMKRFKRHLAVRDTVPLRLKMGSQR